MGSLSKHMLRKLIVDEIKYLYECGCKAEAENPADLIPEFPHNNINADHPHMNMISDYEIARNDNALNAKCPGSYAKTGDQLIVNPEFAAAVINLLMQESGSTCPESSAQALSDIIKIQLNSQ